MNILFTSETLRNLYLTDLGLVDSFHDNKGKAKVKNIAPWEAITSKLASQHTDAGFVSLDPYGSRKIYVWSDIHWGHKNIIKYCNRPYPNVELMNECLIGNYLNVVTPADIVIFGGDIGFMKEDPLNSILDRLPGYKIQIVGNHDMSYHGVLADLNFDERHLCFPLIIEDYDCTIQLLFTHYPLDTTSIPDGCYNIHGHIHDNFIPDKRHVNMCVEHTNFKPKSLNEMIKQAQTWERVRLGLPSL